MFRAAVEVVRQPQETRETSFAGLCSAPMLLRLQIGKLGILGKMHNSRIPVILRHTTVGKEVWVSSSAALEAAAKVGKAAKVGEASEYQSLSRGALATFNWG